MPIATPIAIGFVIPAMGFIMPIPIIDIMGFIMPMFIPIPIIGFIIDDMGFIIDAMGFIDDI